MVVVRGTLLIYKIWLVVLWPARSLFLSLSLSTSTHQQFEEIATETPAGMDEATNALKTLVNILHEKYSVPIKKFLLVGFSQGASMALDLGLALKESVGGLVLWTPVAVKTNIWIEQAKAKKDIPVLHSQGLRDPIVIPAFGNIIDNRVFANHNKEKLKVITFRGQFFTHHSYLTRQGSTKSHGKVYPDS